MVSLDLMPLLTFTSFEYLVSRSAEVKLDRFLLSVLPTLYQSVSNMVKAEFPGTKFLLGPGLHRVAPGVEEVRAHRPLSSQQRNGAR